MPALTSIDIVEIRLFRARPRRFPPRHDQTQCEYRCGAPKPENEQAGPESRASDDRHCRNRRCETVAIYKQVPEQKTLVIWGYQFFAPIKVITLKHRMAFPQLLKGILLEDCAVFMPKTLKIHRICFKYIALVEGLSEIHSIRVWLAFSPRFNRAATTGRSGQVFIGDRRARNPKLPALANHEQWRSRTDRLSSTYLVNVKVT